MEVGLNSDHEESYGVGLAIWNKIQPMLISAITAERIQEIISPNDVPFADQVQPIREQVNKKIKAMASAIRRGRISETKGFVLNDADTNHVRG